MTAPQRLATKNDHNELANHWSDVVKLGLNPVDSDNTYKHHVARLMRVYTNHKTTIDHDTPIPTGKKMSPLTQLYGVHGAISSKVKDENLKRREKKWKSRLITTENLGQAKRKEMKESKKTNDSLKSQETSPQVFSSSSNLSVNHINTHSNRHSSQILQSSQRHRIDDPEMTENDLIANGAYYLSPEQLKTYEDFTELLASFDTYDMVRILEDVYKDAKKQTRLEDYGGTSLS